MLRRWEVALDDFYKKMPAVTEAEARCEMAHEGWRVEAAHVAELERGRVAIMSKAGTVLWGTLTILTGEVLHHWQHTASQFCVFVVVKFETHSMVYSSSEYRKYAGHDDEEDASRATSKEDTTSAPEVQKHYLTWGHIERMKRVVREATLLRCIAQWRQKWAAERAEEASRREELAASVDRAIATMRRCLQNLANAQVVSMVHQWSANYKAAMLQHHGLRHALVGAYGAGYHSQLAALVVLWEAHPVLTVRAAAERWVSILSDHRSVKAAIAVWKGASHLAALRTLAAEADEEVVNAEKKMREEIEVAELEVMQCESELRMDTSQRLIDELHRTEAAAAATKEAVTKAYQATVDAASAKTSKADELESSLLAVIETTKTVKQQMVLLRWRGLSQRWFLVVGYTRKLRHQGRKRWRRVLTATQIREEVRHRYMVPHWQRKLRRWSMFLRGMEALAWARLMCPMCIGLGCCLHSVVASY